MATAFTEIETKYELPEGVVLPSMDGLPGVAATARPAAERLEAEYYDTDDLRLIRSGVTLRRRTGGDDAGWHLKLPVGPHTRRELRESLGPQYGQPPASLTGLVRGLARGERLRPVARMTTMRQRVILLDEHNASLAEVDIDAVSAEAMGEAMVARSWRELEIELTGGNEQFLRAADRLLRREGLERAGRSAKLERALGLEHTVLADSASAETGPAKTGPAKTGPAKTGPAKTGPAKTGPAKTGLTAASPAGEFLRGYLRSQTAVLTSLDTTVRLEEPGAVHKMRIAARRLRSVLQAFPAIFGEPADRVVNELRWLGGVLGSARDAEVLGTHLRDSLSKLSAELVIGPIEARVHGHFAATAAAARRAVIEVLDSDRYVVLLGGLDDLAAAPAAGPGTEPAADVLRGAVQRAYRRTSRRMRRACEAAPGEATDVSLHDARKAAKRARYAAEAVAPVSGPDAMRFARQLKNVQTVLGEHQDTVVARQAVRQLGMTAHLSGENAFSYGLLYEKEACDSQDLRAEAFRTWDHTAQVRYRRWLRDH
jgi:CHAD domain-containing protein